MSGIDPTAAAADLAMSQGRQSAVRSADTAVSSAHGKANIAQVKKSATDFEAVFASEMLSHMFEGVGADPMFGGGNGEEMFKSVLIDQYGKALAQTGKLGIADKVAAELIKAQER